MTKNRFNELRSLETSLPTVNSASKAVDMHPTNQLDPYYLGTLCAEKLMENESLDYNYAAVRLLHDFNRVNQNIGEICEVISKMPEHLKIFFIKAFLHVSNEEQRLYLAKYYLMAILEGDDVLSNWVSDALQEVSKNSIEPLLEWYSASITFNRKICSDKGYVFFKNKRSLTEIYKKCIDVFHGTSQSSEEISKSSDDNYVMHYNLNISNTRTVERVLFIFNKPFTDKNNIHLRVCRTFASLLEEGGVKANLPSLGKVSYSLLGAFILHWGKLEI